MNDSSLFPAQNSTFQSRPPLGEDLLPPVEEPSAKFIIQLFVVPALIVMLIVAVWLAFTWVVRSTELGPDQLIQGIEQGPNVARWQRARELAELLQDKRYPEFRQSRTGAARLAQMLARSLDQADMGEDDIEFRKYLAAALGNFDVQEGTGVLLKAASTNRDTREQKVRDAAIQAIAVRAYNLAHLVPPQKLADPALEPALVHLASDSDPVIRFQTAYALGQLGTPAAIKQLESMVDDPDPGTRYNAAVALAHRGNAKSIETLAEMLDWKESAGVRSEAEEGRPFKRTVIIVSAIDATHALARQNPNADLSPLISALQQLVSTDTNTLKKSYVSPRVVADAKLALNQLKPGK
ncbi:MAG TPA: HEAT repeat domain-containing protein [Lacipirellulaceae bacterium]|nr:HEAT repeat domain-containing protein [Lacipirellulaceae bacterium]